MRAMKANLEVVSIVRFQERGSHRQTWTDARDLCHLQ
jgi:hypothetical protein